MAKPNYAFQKRQKEIAKKKMKEDKLLQKIEAADSKAIGTSHENNQFIAARIGGRKAATLIAMTAKMTIVIRIVRASFSSVAAGL